MSSVRKSNNASYFEIVKLLLEYGANVNAKSYDGRTALTFAVRHPNDTSSLKSVKLLLKNGANVDKKTNCDALMLSAIYSSRLSSL